MTDLKAPILSSSVKRNGPNRLELKTKSMVWWGLGWLTVFAMVVAVIFNMGDGTRTTTPAVKSSSAAPATPVPLEPNTPMPRR